MYHGPLLFRQPADRRPDQLHICPFFRLSSLDKLRKPFPAHALAASQPVYAGIPHRPHRESLRIPHLFQRRSHPPQLSGDILHCIHRLVPVSEKRPGIAVHSVPDWFRKYVQFFPHCSISYDEYNTINATGKCRITQNSEFADSLFLIIFVGLKFPTGMNIR